MSEPAIALILDWDGTMTVSDTTSVIGTACLRRALSLSASPPADAAADASAMMALFTEQYLSDRARWAETFRWHRGRETVDDEVAFLSQGWQCELESYLRVRQAVMGMEGGIQELLKDEGGRDAWMVDEGRRAVQEGEVKVRDVKGLRRLLREVERRGQGWTIVSVSWSRMFVVGAMREAGLVADEATDKELVRRIRCNELLAPLRLDRMLKPVLIQTAMDKVEAMKGLVDDLAEGATNGRSGTSTVYVGDSTTDLGCLAQATLGVCMRDGNVKPEDDKLRQTLDRLHLQCPEASDLTSRGPVMAKGICWVQSFEEVRRIIFHEQT